LSPSQIIPLSVIRPVNASVDKISGIPGNRAIWVGIFAEFTEFLLMFMVYFFARANHPQLFHDGPQKLSVLAGTANTVIMITSSFFVAKAVLSMRQDRTTASFRWLFGCINYCSGLSINQVYGNPLECNSRPDRQWRCLSNVLLLSDLQSFGPRELGDSRAYLGFGANILRWLQR